MDKYFGLYNGYGDFITDSIRKLMCKFLNIEGTDTFIKASKQYQKQYNTDNIKIKVNYNGNYIYFIKKLQGSLLI